jgi:hypothetical protein
MTPTKGAAKCRPAAKALESGFAPPRDSAMIAMTAAAVRAFPDERTLTTWTL